MYVKSHGSMLKSSVHSGSVELFSSIFFVWTTLSLVTSRQTKGFSAYYYSRVLAHLKYRQERVFFHEMIEADFSTNSSTYTNPTFF